MQLHSAPLNFTVITRGIMNYNWINNFVKEKVHIAKCLKEGECNGSYSDAIIILASSISGLASEVWPGKDKDRKKFVELCVQFSSENLESKKISIPLLMAHLHKHGDTQFIQIMKEKFPKEFMMFPRADTLVITGKDTDLFDREILELYNMDIKTLRKFSYANLFYTEIRCSLVHEYRLGKQSSQRPMSKENQYISYVNWAAPDTNRTIHFSYDWVEHLAISIADHIDKNNIELTYPDKWWIEG